MKGKKIMALLLAAVMSIGGIAQTAAVSGAEFTDGTLQEEVLPENPGEENAGAQEITDDVQEVADVTEISEAALIDVTEEESAAVFDVTETESAAGTDALFTDGSTEENPTEEESSVGAMYYLDWIYPNGTDYMFPGETMEIPISLMYRYFDEEGNEQCIPAEEAYTLSAEENEGSQGVLTWQLTQEEDGSWVLRVTAAAEADGYAGITIRAIVSEETTETELTSEEIGFTVTGEYLNLEPVALENVLVGRTLSLDGLYVASYSSASEQENGTPLEEGSYRLRIDTESVEETCWENVSPASEDGLITALKRTSTDGISVTVVAEQRATDDEGNPMIDESGSVVWNEICSRGYWFDGLDYSTDLQESYQTETGETGLNGLRGGNYSWVFSDEELTFTLNPENLDDKRVSGANDGTGATEDVDAFTVEWTVGTWVDSDNGAGGSIPAPLTEDYYSISGDCRSITLHGAKLAELYVPGSENSWVDVQARIMVDDIELFCTGIGVDVRDPVCEFSLPLNEPGDTDMVFGSNIWLDANQTLYVEDSEHPHGEVIPTAITNVEILSQYTWSENGDILLWDYKSGSTSGLTEDQLPVQMEAQDGGWNFYSLDYNEEQGMVFGYARLKLTYLLPDGTSTSSYGNDPAVEGIAEGNDEDYRISVLGDTYRLELIYPDDTDQMLMGGTMTVKTRLYHSWIDENGNYQEEPVTDYKLQLPGEFDTDLLESIALDESGTSVTITAQSGLEDTWGTGIYVEAYMRATDEEGNLAEGYETWPAASVNLYVNVQSGYYVIRTNGEMNNPLVGESLDLNMYAPAIYLYTADNEAAVEVTDTDQYRIRLASGEEENAYDPNCWEVVQDDTANAANIPTLKRIRTDGTGFDLIAEQRAADENGAPVVDEEGNEVWEEICRQWYWFDGLDYSVWFEDLRQDDYATSVFSDETYELQLNTDNLRDKGAVSVEWQVGTRKEDTEEGDGFAEIASSDVLTDGSVYADLMTVIAAQDAETGAVTYTASINGNILRNVYAELESGEHGEYWVEVRATVYAGSDTDSRIELETAQAGVWSREAQESFSVGDTELLPGTGYVIEPVITRYVENPEYPNGGEMQAIVKDVQVQNNIEDMGENADPVCSLNEESDPAQGWLIVAGEQPGSAIVTVTYQLNETSEELYTFTFLIYVNSEIYWLEVEYPENTDLILPGIATEFPVHVYHYWSEKNESGEITYDDEEITGFTLTAEEGSYDSELVTAAQSESGGSVVITPLGTEGRTSITLIAKGMNADEEPWEAWGSMEIEVINSYCTMETEDLINTDGSPYNPNLDEELDLNAMVQPVYRVEIVNGTSSKTEVEGVQYILEYDENEWSAVSEGSNGLPVLKRQTTAGTGVTLIAKRIYMDAWSREQEEELCRFDYWFDALCEEHSWEEKPSTPATCTEDGSIVSRCTVCSTTKTEIVEKTGHSWGEYVPDAGGTTETRTCSVCGATESQAVTQQPSTDQPSTDQPSTDQPSTDQPSTDQPSTGQPSTDQPSTDQPSTGQPSTDQPSTDQPSTDQPSTDQPSTDQPSTGQPSTDPQPAQQHEHTWGEYTVTKEATAVAEGTETRTCTGCGETESRTIEKLKATITVPATSIPLKVRQKFTFKVTGLAEGDTVASWKSSNTRVVKVSGNKNGTIRLTALKKTGSAKLTITTAGGAKKVITVKVQKKDVLTKKIRGLSRKLTLKRRASVTLKPVLNPISSKQKITYTSSNKKVASVSAKGVVKALKAGKTVITVKSGKATFKCTITVKK